MDINRIRSQITTHYKEKKEEYLRNKNKRRNDIWLKYYSSQEWKTLRNNYYQLHPCCEVCARQDKIVSADEVHHKHKFSSGLTEEAKWRLLLNSNNLISLCTYHHDIAHKYMKEYGTDVADIDDILYYEDRLNKIVQ